MPCDLGADGAIARRLPKLGGILWVPPFCFLCPPGRGGLAAAWSVGKTNLIRRDPDFGVTNGLGRDLGFWSCVGFLLGFDTRRAEAGGVGSLPTLLRTVGFSFMSVCPRQV